MNDPDFIWSNNVLSMQESEVGKLAKDLATLKQNNLDVQNFFVISSRIFSLMLSNNSEILSLINHANIEDVESLTYSSKQIQKIINAFSFPEDFTTRLLENYRALEESDSKYNMLSNKAKELIHSGRDLPTVTLRLSTEKNICSYESKINILGISQLIGAIKSLWSDIFSIKSLFIIKKNNIQLNTLMPAIIVQKTLLPSKSGDIFTVNPLNSNNLQIYIQAHWGLNNDFIETASNYIFDKSSESIVSSKINVQKNFVTKKSLNSEIIVQPIPENYQKASPLSENEVKILAKIAQKIESIFNYPQKINWIVFNKKVLITKTEPISNIFKEPVKPFSEVDDFIVRATPTNNFSCSGIYYRNFVFDKNAIFQVNEARASFDPYLILSSGIVSKSNSISSYLVVSCQDIGIPCLINVPSDLSLNEGQKIKLHGPYILLDREAYSMAGQPQMQSAPIEDSFQETEELSQDNIVPSEITQETYAPQPDYQNQIQSQPQVPEQESVFSEQETEQDYYEPEEKEELSPQDIITATQDLEQAVNELVLKNAEKRRTQQLSPEDEKNARILSEAEWIIRDLKKKLSQLDSKEFQD